MPATHPTSGPLFKRLVIAAGAFLILAVLGVVAAKTIFERLEMTTTFPDPSRFEKTTVAGAGSGSGAAATAEIPVGASPGTAPPPGTATRERPEFGRLDQRAEEDELKFQLRRRLVGAFDDFVSVAKLEPAEDKALRQVLFDAQLNYALWKHFFVKQAVMDDLLAGKPNVSEMYIEQTMGALSRFIPTAAAAVLSRQHKMMFEGASYKYLAGTGVTSRPFDVDELAALGVGKDTNRAQLRELILKRLNQQLPGNSGEAVENRQFISTQLHLN